MISVLIKSAETFDIDPSKVRRRVKRFLQEQGLNGKAEVSIFFVDPAGMRGLNKRYRRIDKATSVLAFSQQGGPDQPTPDEILRLGDVVICPEIAQKQNLKISFLLRHGLKNLLSEISAAKNKRT